MIMVKRFYLGVLANRSVMASKLSALRVRKYRGCVKLELHPSGYCTTQDSDLEPIGYESTALTVELVVRSTLSMYSLDAVS